MHIGSPSLLSLRVENDCYRIHNPDQNDASSPELCDMFFDKLGIEVNC